MTRRGLLTALPLLALLAVATPVTTAGAAPATAAAPAPVVASTAARVSSLALLAQLRVARETSTGYSRVRFPHWTDADRDGCTTRAEVLLTESRTRPRVGANCRITGARWVSAYDGKTHTTYTGLDIDHTVALAEAWSSGARSWNVATRVAYANDLGYPYSLNAVTASVNRSKGDKEPGSWLPPRTSARCGYVAAWVAVKWRWGLTVDASEKASLVRKLKACGTAGYILKPTKARVVIGGSNPITTPPPSTTPTRPPSGGLDPRYPTCTAAKAAGYGPYIRGRDPEYAWYTDRDHDGIVCE